MLFRLAEGRLNRPSVNIMTTEKMQIQQRRRGSLSQGREYPQTRPMQCTGTQPKNQRRGLGNEVDAINKNKTQTVVTNICLNCITFINLTFHMLQHTSRPQVPQGSIFGPLLFTLYIDDLFRVPKHCKPLGYVDDTKLFLGFPSNKLHDVISAVNEDLKEILSWCCRNSLLINPDKTKLLYVGVPQLMRTFPATLPSATVLGSEIKPVTVTNDLGVHISIVILTLMSILLKPHLAAYLN